MQGTVILCDWAEAVQGKLYMQGAGWTRIMANQSVSFALGTIIRVPYTETNASRHAVVALVDEDGKPFPEDNPAKFEFDFEVGRPPGMKAGQEQNLCFAAKINGIKFPPAGYAIELRVDEKQLDLAAF